MAIDPNIKKKADDIRNKIYGKEVRESLASGLEAMSSDVVENEGRQSVVEGRQDSVESQWQAVSDEMTDKDVISAPEIIAARDGEPSLKAKIDKNHNEVTSQLAHTIEYLEVEPEDLRTADSETDADLLQKAINLTIGSGRSKVSIKLGRIYTVDKTLMINERPDTNINAHITFKDAGGGLTLGHDGYMFDGVRNGGGILFQSVKFIGNDLHTHPLFNGDNLIQISFLSCQFAKTHTIVHADGFLQSIRFHMCNFKGMRTYQIEAPIAYDTNITNCLVEWGMGGLIHLHKTEDYCAFNVLIKDNVIEGISEETPIKIGAAFRLTIEDNYFEGNNYYDIEADLSQITHKSLTIAKNFFGAFSLARDKDCCVKVGRLRGTVGYDFGGNSENTWGESAEKPVFDFGYPGNVTAIINMHGGTTTFKGIQASRINDGSGSILSSHGNTESHRLSSVIASFRSKAPGNSASGGAAVIASGNAGAGHSGGKSSAEGAVVMSSTNTENTNRYSVAGGYQDAVDNVSTANRKWHLYSISGNIQHSGTHTPGHAFTDFAELFPNLTATEQGYGLLQTLDGHGVRPANEGEQVIGVTSATAGVILGDTPFSWQGRWMKDEFGAYIYEEVKDDKGNIIQQPKENPEWNPELEQTSRLERPDEWTVVGLLGQVYVRLTEDVQAMDYVKATAGGIGEKSSKPTNLKVMKITQKYDANKGYKIGFCLLK